MPLTNIFAPLTAFISFMVFLDSAHLIVDKAVVSHSVFDQLPAKDIILTTASILSLIGIFSARKSMLAFTLALMIYTTCASVSNLLQVSLLAIKNKFDFCEMVGYRQVPCWFTNGFIIVTSVLAYILTALASITTYNKLTTVTLSISEQRAYATHRAEPLLLSSKPIVSPDDFSREEQRIPDIFV